MTLAKSRPHAKRRWALLVGAVAGATLLLAGITLAVHDLAFQLDGDVSASTTTQVGNTTQSFDWDSFFNASGQPTPALPDASRPGFTASAFSVDFQTTVNKKGATVFSTLDPTTFTTGSKDTLEINTGWQCASSNNVLSKNDIMNAYSVAYTNPVADANQFLSDGVTPNPYFGKHHQILYFGLERNSNNGDANVAFWFLQNKVGCDSSSGTADWTGTHADGDILIVAAFTNGGGVAGIDAYRWNVVNGVGSLGTTSVAHGKDCISGGGTLGGDAICATTNGGDATTGGLDAAITTPWFTANTNDGLDHKLQPSEFFEGGIDLTATNLGGHCLNTFVGDTRSSQSLTATIFDYALGTLGECKSDTTTTPMLADGTTKITTAPIPASGTLGVTDSAVVKVTGIDTFSSSLSFSLCGPSDLNSTATCDTGGALISTQTITANGTYVSSPVTQISSAGRYCWRADFGGDTTAGVPPSSDHSAGECFVVTPLQPTLRTQAGTSPVDFGSAVTDTATLSGTANEPGSGGVGPNGTINPTTAGGPAQGSITFTLYKSDCTTLATGTGTNPQTISLTAPGGDATYGPVSFTPDAPGTYHWVATYGGDPPNTKSSVATDLACGVDTNEDVVVRQIPTEIKTKQSWIPNDTATISSTVGNLAGGGTVAFSLYSGSTCGGPVLFSQTKTLTGGAPTEQVSTANTGSGAGMYTITTGYTDASGSSTGMFSWKVVYTPSASDTAHLGIQSSCSAENFSTTYTNDAGPGTALP